MSGPSIPTRFHVRVPPDVAYDGLIDVRTGVFSRLVVNSGIEQSPAGPAGTGTEFRVSRHNRPWMVIRITEATPPHHFRTESVVRNLPKGLVEYTFEPSGDGTAVHIESSAGGIGRRWLRPFFTLYFLAFRPWLARKARANGAAIARDLEARVDARSSDIHRR